MIVIYYDQIASFRGLMTDCKILLHQRSSFGSGSKGV